MKTNRLPPVQMDEPEWLNKDQRLAKKKGIYGAHWRAHQARLKKYEIHQRKIKLWEIKDKRTQEQFEKYYKEKAQEIQDLMDELENNTAAPTRGGHRRTKRVTKRRRTRKKRKVSRKVRLGGRRKTKRRQRINKKTRRNSRKINRK